MLFISQSKNLAICIMSIIFLLNKEASGFLKRLQGFLVVYMYMYMYVYLVNHYLTHCCIEFHFYPNEIQSRKHLWICLYHIIIFVSSQHATKLVYMSPNQNFFFKILRTSVNYFAVVANARLNDRTAFPTNRLRTFGTIVCCSVFVT